MLASEKPLPLQIWLQENIECSEQTVGSVKDSRSRFHLERLFLFSWGNTAQSPPDGFARNLPKNLTTHLTHKLCAVLPWVSCVMETEIFPHLVCKKNEKLAIAAMPELWYSEDNLSGTSRSKLLFWRNYHGKSL